MQENKFKLIDLLHISGSIASIIGILIVLLDKTISHFNIGYFVAYFITALLIISILTISIGLLRVTYVKLIQPLNWYFKYSFSLILFVLIFFMDILCIRLLIDIIIPFTVFLVMGRV